jgi:predicted RNA-binding Zn-ribbon protein involved in translation (DUF1610 family)
MSTQTPFRFMDLPKELRLMVYERLRRQIKHVRVFPLEFGKAYTGPPGMVLVHKCLPFQVLCASRDVHAEAKKIFQSTVRDFILEAEPKVIQLSKAEADSELLLCVIDDEQNMHVSSKVHVFTMTLTYIPYRASYTSLLPCPWCSKAVIHRYAQCSSNSKTFQESSVFSEKPHTFSRRRPANQTSDFCSFLVSNLVATKTTASSRLGRQTWLLHITAFSKKMLVKHVGMWAVKPGQSKVLSEEDQPKRFDENHLIRGPLLHATIDKETWVGEWLAS